MEEKKLTELTEEALNSATGGAGAYWKQNDAGLFEVYDKYDHLCGTYAALQRAEGKIADLNLTDTLDIHRPKRK